MPSPLDIVLSAFFADLQNVQALADDQRSAALLQMLGNYDAAGIQKILVGTKHDARRERIERIYAAALKRVLDKALRETIANLSLLPVGVGSQPDLALQAARSKPVAFDFLFSIEDFTVDFFAAMRAAGREAFIESSLGALEDLGLPAHLITPQGIIRDFGIARENKLRDTPDEIYEDIQRTLREGALDGETTEQLGARVQAAFGDVSKKRAKLIAQTETASAYSAAARESMVSAGFTHKRWITMKDERVRDSHRNAEKQGAIPIAEKFSNGLLQPGDPEGVAEEVINCRCYLEAVEGES